VCLGEVLPITCKSGLDVCRHRRLGAIWAFQDAPGSKSMYWAPVSPLQTEATPVLYIPGFGVAMALPILSAADGPSLSRRKSLSYRARGITDESLCARLWALTEGGQSRTGNWRALQFLLGGTFAQDAKVKQ
jgi:hypothetical protein